MRIIVIIFLPINLNMCFGCSKELSHGSFEYTQHMFWLRNKKKKSNMLSYLEACFVYEVSEGSGETLPIGTGLS